MMRELVRRLKRNSPLWATPTSAFRIPVRASRMPRRVRVETQFQGGMGSDSLENLGPLSWGWADRLDEQHRE
jgi:hypothetical protein